jgi:hypothetical protein
MRRSPPAKPPLSRTSPRTSWGLPRAIKAAQATAPTGEAEAVGRRECCWQRAQLPNAIRELVLDDQRLRNNICWSVFDC